MEENMSSPMRTFQSFVDQISIKWLARGILGKQINEMRKKILSGILGKFEWNCFFEFWI
jgi:hypothetical protein